MHLLEVRGIPVPSQGLLFFLDRFRAPGVGSGDGRCLQRLGLLRLRGRFGGRHDGQVLLCGQTEREAGISVFHLAQPPVCMAVKVLQVDLFPAVRPGMDAHGERFSAQMQGDLHLERRVAVGTVLVTVGPVKIPPVLFGVAPVHTALVCDDAGELGRVIIHGCAEVQLGNGLSISRQLTPIDQVLVMRVRRVTYQTHDQDLCGFVRLGDVQHALSADAEFLGPGPQLLFIADLFVIDLGDLQRSALVGDLSPLQKDGTVADLQHALHTVGYEQHRGPGILCEMLHAFGALGGKRSVSRAQHLVDNQDVRLQRGGHRKGQAGIHARGIVFDRLVDIVFQFAELDDLIHTRFDLLGVHPGIGQGCADVLDACKFGMEAGADLQQCLDLSIYMDGPFRGPEVPHDQLEQGALAGAIAANDADPLSLGDRQIDVAQRPELAVPRLPVPEAKLVQPKNILNTVGLLIKQPVHFPKIYDLNGIFHGTFSSFKCCRQRAASSSQKPRIPPGTCPGRSVPPPPGCLAEASHHK